MNIINKNKMIIINKEEFATNFWKSISKYQQNLIVNNTKNDFNIIHNLIDIVTENINKHSLHSKCNKIKNIPILSIYTDGKKEEFFDSEIEIESIDDEEHKSDDIGIEEEKDNILTTPSEPAVISECNIKSNSPSPLSPSPNPNIAIQTDLPKVTNTTSQTISDVVPNIITSIISTYNPITNNIINSNTETAETENDEIIRNNSNDAGISNAELINDDDTTNDIKINEMINNEINENELDINIEEIEQETEERTGYNGDNETISENDENEEIVDINKTKPTLQDIAAYVPKKDIIDHLTNKLSKDELIELLAKKIEIKQEYKYKHKMDDNDKKIRKWKLIQYDKDNNIIQNEEISTKIKKKIKKYLRKKNRLIEMEKNMNKTDVETQNGESNGDEKKQNNSKLDDEINENNKDKISLIDNNNNNNNINLTTTITGDVSFISNNKSLIDDDNNDDNNNNNNNNNKYELTMDTFDCIHIAPSKTMSTQTTPSDIQLNSKFIPTKNISKSKTISNWFVAPLLSSSQTKTLSQTQKIIKPQTIKPSQQNNVEIQEHKESEIQTMKEESEFVSIPVIGPRTAGLSYIDPSIKINEDSLILKFPATPNFNQQSNEIEENKDEEKDEKNVLLQSQSSMMMHSVTNSRMDSDIFDENTMNIGDFQHDIAMIDAQLAHLSSICNRVQNNYYQINKKLDESQEVCHNMNEIKNNRNDGQIGTMKAWSLLQNIQQNLDSIDNEMNKMNDQQSINNNIDDTNNKNHKHQLRNIKAKTKKRKKRKAELTKNLQQQTNLLNAIYNNL